LEVVNSYVQFYDGFDKKIEIENGDIEWIRHYSYEFLKVRKSSSPFYLNCLWKTGDSFFIEKNEIEKLHYKLYTYKELLLTNEIFNEIIDYDNGVNFGVNLRNTCLNLRTGPSIDSIKISCISGNIDGKAGERMKIIDSANDWAKILIETYVYQLDDEDCPSKLVNSQTGWVKAIADNGFPNIWYAVSSY
jgi:hypothetical protein